MHREKGRPSDKRTKCEEDVYDFLDKHNIEYERIDHTVDRLGEAEELLDAVICKNLFLCNRQKTRFYLLMLPKHKKLDTGSFSKLIGSSRLSFADEESMERLLHTRPGSVSVMGLIHDTDGCVTLVADEDVARGEYVGCHPCMNTTSMRIKTEDIFGKFAELTNHPPVFVKIE